MAQTNEKPSETATRVVLSYPADLSSWGRSIVEGRPFRAYLPKAHESVVESDRLEEFVGVGCCGDSLDVALVVESVAGGSRLGPETTVEFVERESCEMAGNWRVQSAGGPSR